MLHAMIARFGLPAVFIGAGIEGEPFAIAGGVLAERAMAPLWAAILAAAAGAFAVDLMWFVLGRRHREHPRVAAARRRPAFRRALALIEAHPRLAVPLFRFAYGIRAVAPIAVGVSDVPGRRFVALDLIASALWGAAFTLVGYGFGAALPPWLTYLSVAGAILGAALLGGGLLASRAPAGER